MKTSLPILRNRGFTLIELMVVLAIVGIMAAMATPSFQTIAANQLLTDTVNELRVSLETARTTALSRNRQVTVAPVTTGDWTSGWRVYVDNKKTKGAFDATVDELIHEREAMNSRLTSATITACAKVNTFSYSADGFLTSRAAGSIPVKHADTSNQKCVVVSTTGRARVCSVSGNVCE
ncbi:MAG: GspH/FimT family pseudopilin [Brachymonas sp.]|nr:GspH/FimT family pseudopilin [Brachymonas sp.]